KLSRHRDTVARHGAASVERLRRNHCGWSGLCSNCTELRLAKQLSSLRCPWGPSCNNALLLSARASSPGKGTLSQERTHGFCCVAHGRFAKSSDSSFDWSLCWRELCRRRLSYLAAHLLAAKLPHEFGGCRLS